LKCRDRWNPRLGTRGSRLDVRQDADRERRKRFRFAPRLDDGEAGPCECQHPRSRLRAGERHVRTKIAIGRFAPQLLANRLRVAEQPIEPAHVDDDEIAV
jgi:hypothetical protein